MNVLGIADGPDAGAALVVQNRVVAAESQSSFDRRRRSRAFPWDAIRAVLQRGGVAPEDVQSIAVAGRVTPPFFLRRHPGLRSLARDEFSPALDLMVFYQAVLRWSGLAALEADRAAEWLHDGFAARGFDARVVLVDVHSALASAAYRNQADDDVLIVTVHPRGDGVALAVHAAKDGQIDRLFSQRGFASLHVHLRRSAAALGLPDARAMWAASGPDTDPELLRLLARSTRAEKGKLSRNRYPLPERTIDYARLADVSGPVAAASVLENLVQAVTGVVRHHLEAHGIRKLVVAGEVFESTRVVSALAELEGVDAIACCSEPGFGALAWGAAADLAGIAPRAPNRVGSEDVSAFAGASADWSELAGIVRDGGRVALYSGASGLTSWDDRVVVSRLDRGPYVPAQRVAVPSVENIPGVDPALVPALQVGAACVPFDGLGAAPDGRTRLVPVGEGPLSELFTHLDLPALRVERLQMSGCGVATVEDAHDAARRARASAFVAGPWQVRL